MQVVNDLSPSMVIGSQSDRMVVNISWPATAIGMYDLLLVPEMLRDLNLQSFL